MPRNELHRVATRCRAACDRVSMFTAGLTVTVKAGAIRKECGEDLNG